VFQRYFGAKSTIYKEVLKNELSKRNIKYTYDAYAVFMVDEKRCIDFLTMFGISDFDCLEHEFTNFLKDLVMKNCDKRLDGKFERFIEEYHDDVKSIIELQMKHKKEQNDYDILSEMTILNDAEYIGSEIRKYRDDSNAEKNKYDIQIVDMGARK